jgi:hypothetical protein
MKPKTESCTKRTASLSTRGGGCSCQRKKSLSRLSKLYKIGSNFTNPASILEMRHQFCKSGIDSTNPAPFPFRNPVSIFANPSPFSQIWQQL